ncbi:probable serine/threonine-protein kinase At1g54610 isoform X1 [Cynara cardunculus var. scolymus]|uniref:probable serine/threonine-protein kinase At1g54610 isoform X1 n=1 Tax=Cynara cardunculus var. scolymus TaxID=59895 RepID=UPI000D626CA4|nr:probable serine/threonine-protein kinase At1g54610 isoform X1 [Cynara cardunculus var. scolymus]
MGCVLVKRATPDHRPKSTSRRRSGEQSSAAENVKQVSLNEVGGNRKDGVVDRIRQSIGEVPAPDRRRPKPQYTLKTSQGWPSWLCDVAGDAIKDWTPRLANTFEKLDKIGQGTYSNVYKARDLISGKIVALKKVRFDNLEPESVKFMAREILILKKLNHPNIIKLEGLVTSRMSCSLYLVFEYMEHDLSGLAAVQGIKFTEPQVKCYMKQLLSGLEHCHENGVLHRDIKGSNLLIDNDGILKIADFGLASFFNPQHKQPMTSRVVTLWYRPPELLLGATYYGVGVDLWSAGCILAELLAGKPILPGRTEVEQLHKIFRLCGSPSEEYWKRHRLPNATLFKPQHPYKRCTAETFKDFPPASLPLLERLLAIDPNERGSATSALNSNFFTAEPYACEPSELPKYPPSKEIDVKLREEEARRQRGLSGKSHAPDGNRRTRPRDRVSRAVPAPEANAEIQSNVDRRRVVTEANAKSKSEKFPPPHQDAAVGYPSNNGGPVSFFTTDDNSFGSSIFDSNSSRSVKEHGTIGGSSRRRKTKKEPPSRAGPSRKFIHTFLPTSISLSMDLGFRGKEPVSDVFGSKR